MRNIILVGKIIFKNVDRTVAFGLYMGTVGGLAIAVAATLLIKNIGNNYELFVQKSLIGIKGRLLVDFANPSLKQRFLERIGGSGFDARFSQVWRDADAVNFIVRQEGRVWRRKYQVTVVERGYLERKLQARKGCGRPEGGNVWYANKLVVQNLPGLDPEAGMSVAIPELMPDPLRGVRLSRCVMDTGVISDAPLVFMIWDTLPLKMAATARALEFNFRNDAEVEAGVAEIDRIMSEMERGPADLYRVHDIFEDKSMGAARAINRLGQWVSLLVFFVSLGLASVVLYFGFSLLYEYKRNTLQTLRILGLSYNEISWGMFLRGGQIAVVSSAIGLALAFLGREIIRVSRIIEYENFFVSYGGLLNFETLATVPVFVACYSFVLSRLILKKKF